MKALFSNNEKLIFWKRVPYLKGQIVQKAINEFKHWTTE